VIDQTMSVKITDLSTNALGGNVGISGVTFDNNGNAATITQSIWADANGLNMKIDSIQGDLVVGGITLGGASIGSVSVSDIQLAGVTQTISGH
jgi:hypothetical protein